MNVQVNKEDMLALFECIENFNNMLLKEVLVKLDTHLRMKLVDLVGILFHSMYNVYHPQIRDLKNEASSIYAAFLSAQKKNDEKASWFYSQYLKKKQEIKSLEDTFYAACPK